MPALCGEGQAHQGGNFKGRRGKTIHQLKIFEGEFYLDGVLLRGVTAYEVKSSTGGPAELNLKLLVNLSDSPLRKHSANDLTCYLPENAK